MRRGNLIWAVEERRSKEQRIVEKKCFFMVSNR
jgi:hypothetical protein